MTTARGRLEPSTPETVGSVPWWHLAPITLVLLVSSFFVGHDGYVFIDEAALLAQVELVGDGSWTADRPLADMDPDGAYAPMARSTLTDDGFAPFPNHPLHVLVATAAKEVGGAVGVRMLSVLGVVGASAAAGWLASDLSRRHGATAMWLTAVASPLAFDANLVVAHAPAAAVGGLAFVLVFRVAPRLASGRAEVAAAVAVAALVALGALLRSEVVLLGALLGAVSVAHALRARSRNGVLAGLGAGAGAASAYLLEPRWMEAVAESSPGPKVIAASSRGGVSGAGDGAMTVLFGLGSAGMALVLCLLFAVAAVVALRVRPADPGIAVVLAGGAIAAGVANLLDAGIVPGLVLAFPLLAVGVVSLSRRQVWPTAIRRSCHAVGLFALLVLITQYSVGGGAEWGWRYVAVAMPPACAALSIPLVDLARASARPAHVALGGLVVAGLLVPVSGIVAQRRAAHRVDRLLDRTDEQFHATGADLIVAADSSFGRYAWPRSITGDVVTIRDATELDELFDRLGARDVERVLLVWDGGEPPVPVAAARPAGEMTILLDRAYAARPYDIVPNVRSPS